MPLFIYILFSLKPYPHFTCLSPPHSVRFNRSIISEWLHPGTFLSSPDESAAYTHPIHLQWDTFIHKTENPNLGSNNKEKCIIAQNKKSQRRVAPRPSGNQVLPSSSSMVGIGAALLLSQHSCSCPECYTCLHQQLMKEIGRGYIK